MYKLYIYNRRSIVYIIAPVTFIFLLELFLFNTSSIVSIELAFLFNYRHFLILDSLTWDISTRHEEIDNINRHKIYLFKIH